MPPRGVHDVLQRTSRGYLLTTKARLHYQFDDDGRLLSVSDQSGNRTVVQRDGDGVLTGVLDASGIETAFERDDHGRITAVLGVLARHWS